VTSLLTGRQVEGCHLQLVNHHDPVMAFHLGDGDGETELRKLARP
jgi:hypothetical protein